MPKTTPRQRKTIGRVMHEYKHGELKRGRGGKVKSRKQAIAIALSEAGASKRGRTKSAGGNTKGGRSKAQGRSRRSTRAKSRSR